MKGLKNILYMSAALGMLVYAVPQLEVGKGWTLPTVFAIVWIAIALLVVAAHLHTILGVDEETRAELDKIKRMRRWQAEQRLAGSSRIFQNRK